MNRRDQELLNKQFSWVNPSPRNDRVLISTVVVVFIVGLALGTMVAEQGDQPGHIISNGPAWLSSHLTTRPPYRSN